MPLTEALFYILLAARRPIHGYGIIQEVAEMTGGRVNLGPGTLYGAISTWWTGDGSPSTAPRRGPGGKRSTSSPTRAGPPSRRSLRGCGSWCATGRKWRRNRDSI